VGAGGGTARRRSRCDRRGSGAGALRCCGLAPDAAQAERALTLFAASIAAIVLLVALAWGLGFRTRPRLADEAEARAIADAALYGFDAETVALDPDNSGACLHDADGREVRIDAFGDRWVVRAT
jgi:hypothetical protein